MARTPIPDLIQFLVPFDQKVQETALSLRAFVLDNYLGGYAFCPGIWKNTEGNPVVWLAKQH